MAYNCITTILAPAASYALATLEDVKTELSINDSSRDAWLNAAIVQVSKSIERYCKRPFAPVLLQDQFDVQQDPFPYQTPGGFAALELSHWPALAVVSVVQTTGGASQPSTVTLVAGKDYRLDPATGRVLRLSPFTGATTLWEALPVVVVYSAGFGTSVSETNQVTDAEPYQATVQQAATFSCDCGLAYASGAALVGIDGVPTRGQYSVANGVYTFDLADAGQLLTFNYATVAIPEDLVEICLRLITARFRALGRDPALVQDEQPGMGTQRYWFGNAPGQTGPFPPDISAALEYYRVPTIA